MVGGQTDVQQECELSWLVSASMGQLPNPPQTLQCRVYMLFLFAVCAQESPLWGTGALQGLLQCSCLRGGRGRVLGSACACLLA